MWAHTVFMLVCLLLNCVVGKYSEADEGLHSDASEVSDLSISRFSVRSTQSEQPNRTLRSFALLRFFTCADDICTFVIYSLTSVQWAGS